MKSKKGGIIVKLGEKKSKCICRDGTNGNSEAETANAAVSEQQESRGSCGCLRNHIAACILLSLISVQG